LEKPYLIGRRFQRPFRGLWGSNKETPFGRKLLDEIRDEITELNTHILNFKKMHYRKTAWEEYSSTLSNQTPTQEIWRKIGKIKGRPNSSGTDQDIVGPDGHHKSG
jgi:hypothetical protein